jgi:hypothetical protein
MDNAARARQRVLALFLPIAAVLYVSAEVLSPKGTDQVITTTATALKVLPIAATHPTQLYAAGSLAILALGALAVSYAAIATLARNRGSAGATAAALIGGIGAFCGAIVNVLVYANLAAAAATAHLSAGAAARFLVTTFNSGFGHGFSRLFHRHLRRAGPHGVCAVAEPERSALAGGAVLRRPGSRPAADILRTRRNPVHAAVCGRDGPAGRPDLAGGRPARQPATTGAGPRTRWQHVKASRPAPAGTILLPGGELAERDGATITPTYHPGGTRTRQGGPRRAAHQNRAIHGPPRPATPTLACAGQGPRGLTGQRGRTWAADGGAGRSTPRS